MTAFDFPQLKRALEQSDAVALIRLYARDAEMTVVDRHRPPQNPLRLLGRDAIAAFWRDICARDMTHRVAHEVLSENRAAFVEHGSYPDGCHVLSATTLDLHDGRIVRHLTVQASDVAI